MTPDKKRPKVVTEPGSHKESEGATPKDPPQFEKIDPQLHTKTDEEVQHTEINNEEDEKVQTIEEMKGGPIAKRIKKILYSDKSESSIDEMMEDTPSNYNIPNGRIEGRSRGLKALLLQEKKRGLQRTDPLSVDLRVGPTEAGRTLQPESLNKTLAAAKGGKRGHLSPIKKNDLLSPKAQGSGGKVNNLFKEPSNGTIP